MAMLDPDTLIRAALGTPSGLSSSRFVGETLTNLTSGVCARAARRASVAELE